MLFRNCFVTLSHFRYTVSLMKVFCRLGNQRQFYCSKVNETDYVENDMQCCENIGTGQPVTRLALKLLYIGANYKGMQYQDTLPNTIEDYLFRALGKMRLIQDSKSSRFQKSSRTDIGVSAISQVMAFDVNHEFVEELRKNTRRLEKESQDKQDYLDVKHFNSPIRRLNRLLPIDIKVLAWALVPDEFDPRKQTGNKTYKYWFRKEGLNIKVMTDACKKFEGKHDFRNLCTLQYKSSFICHVTSATIKHCEDDSKVCVFTVSGDRFLMHQIRYMMGILFLIGEGSEDPEVIDELLDVDTNPCKPSYSKAPGSPLCLFKAEMMYDIKWLHCADVYQNVYELVKQKYIDSLLMANMTKRILDELKNTDVDTEGDCMKLEEVMQQKIKPIRRTAIMSTEKGRRGPTVETFRARWERKTLRKKICKGEIADISPDDYLNNVESLFLSSEDVHLDLNKESMEDSDKVKSEEVDNT